jgi:hypothetical protein
VSLDRSTLGKGDRTPRRTINCGKSALILVAVLGLVSAACSDGESGESDGSGRTGVRLILGWVASPQFGGFFAAQQQGYYEKVGLDVMLEGGKIESPIQVVAAGGPNSDLATPTSFSRLGLKTSHRRRIPDLQEGAADPGLPPGDPGSRPSMISTDVTSSSTWATRGGSSSR